MPHFCTYFDHNYLPRGLVLYDTLRKHCPDAVLHVLALSPACAEVLGAMQLPGLVVTPLALLEASDPQLAATRRTRSQVEYYFTLSPCWPLYVFQTCADVDLLTYIDADCALWGDPLPALSEMEHLSVGLVGHRFAAAFKHLERYGIYNVGWLSFTRDADGLACLDWWREQCLAWCYDRLEGDKFADQKYLDGWPQRFSGARELLCKGVNVAPWNIGRFDCGLKNGNIFVDDEPLICYHFHGMRELFPGLWRLGMTEYGGHLSLALREGLYLPYVRHLQQRTRDVAALLAARMHGVPSLGHTRTVRSLHTVRGCLSFAKALTTGLIAGDILYSK